jgi:dihydrofolate synthase/folylpolyglutamate synthase
MNNAATPLQTLAQWLDYIERQHPQHIAMGLDRVAAVRDALRLNPSFPVIAVGGTNGKGSACSMLEAILKRAGYKVGCYTSPHLLRYNERVRIDRREVSDGELVRAFAAVDAARSSGRAASGSAGGERQPVPLTYFEFGTLAAVWLFVREEVDIAVLEVGLGGRLDAVNAFDAACALVTSVDLDHMDYLGPTREHIGFEKAGIFRPGRPAVCGASPVPQSVARHAHDIGARLLLRDRDFGFVAGQNQWQYWGPRGKRGGLPHPALRGRHQLANAAVCVTALDTLRDDVPVTMDDIRTGLLQADNPGRFQVLPGRPVVVLDVAHNPHAAQALADTLARMERRGRTIAVFSMLRDKDIGGVIEAVKRHVDHWCIAPIDAPRGAPVEVIARYVREADAGAPLSACASLEQAFVQAWGLAKEDDKILAFGSFYTVAAVMQARQARSSACGNRGTATG